MTAEPETIALLEQEDPISLLPTALDARRSTSAESDRSTSRNEVTRPVGRSARGRRWGRWHLSTFRVKNPVPSLGSLALAIVAPGLASVALAVRGRLRAECTGTGILSDDFPRAATEPMGSEPMTRGRRADGRYMSKTDWCRLFAESDEGSARLQPPPALDRLATLDFPMLEVRGGDANVPLREAARA